jgi:hypothetical protein
VDTPHKFVQSHLYKKHKDCRPMLTYSLTRSGMAEIRVSDPNKQFEVCTIGDARNLLFNY